ncbi:MAG TPA: HDOD domain-containing protein [Isosphaeraceae bacterium]|nr:HDOD domain-containing protein [Isosphaeraceae bacterium]
MPPSQAPAQAGPIARADDPRRALERLGALPLRPTSARAILAGADPAEFDRLRGLDPGWTPGLDPLDLVADRPWWPSAPGGAVDRLWRHAVATAIAARKLADEAGDPEPDRLARAGLLHRLGDWAVAAVAPDWLDAWYAEPDPSRRRGLERAALGRDASALGRDLAEDWRLDPLVIDATWLVADPRGALDACSAEPGRLALLRKASLWAERTPWALARTGSRPMSAPDPRLHLLIAEVQLRCDGGLAPADANGFEADTARRLARLRLDHGQLLRAHDADWRRLQAALDALDAAELAASATLEQAKLAALAEFAAGAGHELNNPLAVIQGRAQLLLAKRPDADDARALRAIIAQAQRAHRILRDLMYFARPPESRPRPCLTDEVLRGAVRDLADEAEGRGVGLSAETRDSGPKGWADPDPLRHLADVFLRNALEATPTGGTVRAVATGDDRRLRWTFRDDGRGLAPAAAEHLFDPFYCGRQAGRGLGLGLPRAARFVALAGGSIRWRPAPSGRGTVFTVELPTAGLAPDAGCGIRNAESEDQNEGRR